MRRKKQKHTRRALRFYRINFGFRPPYKILVDGNFINAIIQLKRGHIESQLSHFLGDKCRVFTTRCCIHELKSMGPDLADARKASKRLGLHHCGHEEPVSASECLMSQVDQDNQEHFFIATQDRHLQNTLLRQPAGVVLFATVNGIQMEMPSEKQKSHVVHAGQQKMLPGELERQSNMVASEDGPTRQHNSMHRRIKRAKGPNPLSMKSKKDKRDDAGSTDPLGGNNNTKKRRVRKSRIRPDNSE